MNFEDATDPLHVFVAQYVAGNAVGLMLGSFTCCQGLFQLWSTPLEVRKLYRKTLCLCLCLLAVYLGLLLADTILTFGDGFGDVPRVYNLSKPLCLSRIVCGLLASTVQSVYAYRAWHLLGCRLWLAIILIPLCWVTAATWLWSGIGFYTAGGQFFATPGSRAEYIAATVADVAILALMLLGLGRAKQMTAANGTRARRLLSAFAITTVSCNGLTTVLCIFQLSNTYTLLGAVNMLDQWIPSFYVLSFLCWLLVRRRLVSHPTRAPEPEFTEPWTGCDQCGTHAHAIRRSIRGVSDDSRFTTSPGNDLNGVPVLPKAVALQQELSQADEKWAREHLMATG